MADKDEWGTPQDFFDELDKEFNFNLDPCANKSRLLTQGCRMLNITKEANGLSGDWSMYSVFVNPPYSGNNIEKWVKKCHEQKDKAKVIVLLIPATKTGTEYFHKYVIPFAEIRFVKGRINFVPLAGQNDNSNPLYSLLCIFRREGADG